MTDKNIEGMSANAALRLEFAVIGLGILALFMIFQPFSLTVFSIGCGLVVLAALANNLLPLAEPGTPARTIVFAATIVALIFCTALIVAIVAAYLYGLAFLKTAAGRFITGRPCPAVLAAPARLGACRRRCDLVVSGVSHGKEELGHVC